MCTWDAPCLIVIEQEPDDQAEAPAVMALPSIQIVYLFVDLLPFLFAFFVFILFAFLCLLFCLLLDTIQQLY